jgi:hypothetical protein
MWYLDDSNIVGTLEGLRNCLEVALQEGPSLGLHLNCEKSCITGKGLDPEILQQHGLGDLKLSLEDGEPAAVVLGCPLGSPVFVKRAVGAVVAKVKSFHEALSHVEDPQIELYLSRLSLGTCRVTHLLRMVSHHLIRDELHALDAIFFDTISRLAGMTLPPEAWQQAGLPVRLGGLGMTRSSAVAPAALVSSALRFAVKAEALGLPPEAAQPSAEIRVAAAALPSKGCAVAALRELLTSSQPLEVRDTKFLDQDFWTLLVHQHDRESLLAVAPARDHARLVELADPMAGSWLTPPPSEALGLAFTPAEYRVLLRWRLGLVLRPGPPALQTCDSCGEMEDLFGDHRLCCIKASHIPRHKGIVDALARSIVTSGARVEKDVAVAGKERPADVMIYGWGPKDEAVDVTVSHTVATFDNPGALDRLSRAAMFKHHHYDVSCRQANLGFRVFGLTSFGSASPETMGIMGDLRAHLCERFGKREGGVLAQQAVEKVSVACMKGVACELLQGCAEYLAPEARVTLAPSLPVVDGGLDDKGYRQWRTWARVHGFEPEPPSGIPFSTGVRFVTRGSAAAPPAEEEVPLNGEPGLQRVLVWASADLAERVWAWK